MLFCEPLFLFVFLPLLLALYYAAPASWRNLILTLASLAFYVAGQSDFLGWLLASIALNYGFARLIQASRGTRQGFFLLTVGVTSDLLLLLFFKYARFFVSNLNQLLEMVQRPAFALPSIALPLGISFFTFHKISYKVDVWRGTAQAQKKPLDLALYILLFPQLIAGPIIRFHDIADTLARRHTSYDDLVIGVRRFIVGLAKKMLLANTFALGADQIFGSAGQFAGVPANQLTCSISWLGAICFALQIYFDFSGYSDMAIGLGRLFGFHFLENFNHPYAAHSVTDFWRRWHMSLSRWFRDYLYIPLGGNRHGPLRTYVNLYITFFLCGLWHGASWNFVFWGLFHGSLLVLERGICGAALSRLPKALQHVRTMLSVLFGWVLFRADDLHQAWHFLRAMLGLGGVQNSAYTLAHFLTPDLARCLVVGAVASTPFAQQTWRAWHARSQGAAAWPAVSRACSCAAIVVLFVCSLAAISVETYNPFIYFRF